MNFLTHQLPFKTVLTCNDTTSQPVTLHAKQSDSVLSEDSKPCCCDSKVKWGPCQAWKVTLERDGTKQARERSAAVTCPSESKKEDNMEWPCKEEVGTVLPQICPVRYSQWYLCKSKKHLPSPVACQIRPQLQTTA